MSVSRAEWTWVVRRSCDLTKQVFQWSNHLKNPKHLARERLAKFKVALEEAEKVKHDVTVSNNLDFGIQDQTQGAKGAAATLKIELLAPHSQIAIADIKLGSA